jgi:hypothetical protein
VASSLDFHKCSSMPRCYGSLKKTLTRRGNSEFPSWSWMGWEGAVHLTGWKGGYDYKHVKKTSEDDEELRPHLWSKQSSCLIVSCLEWRAKTESNAARHKLKVTGSKFRSVHSLDSSRRPLGRQYTILARKRPRDASQACWIYNGKQEALFEYPIPLRKSVHQHTLPVQTEWLSALTSRARLRVRRRHQSQLWTNVVDKDEKMIGVLRLLQ